ncbi:MAG: hypothetical protein GX789_12900 [Pseudomonas formosensis]|nr:hypothetical protein [Halopseudomonas formosensis]
MLDAQAWGALLFVRLYALATVLFLPSTVLALAGGQDLVGKGLLVLIAFLLRFVGGWEKISCRRRPVDEGPMPAAPERLRCWPPHHNGAMARG